MNLFRNKEIKVFLFNYLLLAIAASVVASFISIWAVILVVSICVISALLFILFTRKRYQAISDLNVQIDSILHGEYNINLIPDEEGELAVLCSELSKMTLRMRDQAERLEKDKRYLSDSLAERLQGMLEAYPDYAFEGRVQELADEMQIQQGLRMIVYLFAGILTCIGLANIFASTLGQIHQRKREFARYFAVGLTPKGAAKIWAWEAAIVALRPILLTIVVNIPLMAFMLDAGGITAGDFIAKRLPLIPAILLFVAVIGLVALAYYLGGKKICNMNLVEVIKDDTL